ncbi:MAG: AraC family transcriptional regulator [Hymenobacteraceae bacterium]|nr:AraC family transcriptional regulator [Hymenobacteraceae bacterium]
MSTSPSFSNPAAPASRSALRELTGLTPAAYLREVRLERARQLLEARTTQTVAEIACAVGFEDAQYFGKVFFKRYGKRASEYLRA